MKSLHDMTIGERIALTVVIVLVIIFAFAFIGWISGGWTEGENEPLFEIASSYSRIVKADVPEPCMNVEMKEQVRTLLLEALDESFKDRINHLYGTWLRDEQGQPGRAKVGTNQSINAYLHARQAFEKWNPSECPAG